MPDLVEEAAKLAAAKSAMATPFDLQLSLIDTETKSPTTVSQCETCVGLARHMHPRPPQAQRERAAYTSAHTAETEALVSRGFWGRSPKCLRRQY